MEKNLTKEKMLQALRCLDDLILKNGEKNIQIQLIIGGGGAMILAHHFPLATIDLDAIPKGIELSELDRYVKKVAEELQMPPDWLNPYYASFSHTLPSDYGQRLISVFSGKVLKALALGKEEMLIMKCFAHRQKDVGHAKALIKQNANVKTVEAHIESLKKKGIPGAQEALDFLDDLLDQI